MFVRIFVYISRPWKYRGNITRALALTVAPGILPGVPRLPSGPARRPPPPAVASNAGWASWASPARQGWRRGSLWGPSGAGWRGWGTHRVTGRAAGGRPAPTRPRGDAGRGEVGGLRARGRARGPRGGGGTGRGAAALCGECGPVRAWGVCCPVQANTPPRSWGGRARARVVPSVRAAVVWVGVPGRPGAVQLSELAAVVVVGGIPGCLCLGGPPGVSGRRTG